MKTLFLIAVVSSIGYLAYQESPRIEQIFATSWFSPDNAKITMESVKHELQKKLDDVTSEREALYELLAEKEALLMARKKQDIGNKSTENKDPMPLPYGEEREQTVQEAVHGTIQNSIQENRQHSMQYGAASKRRGALRELAQRMELQALGLGVNE
ncbi:hypothetical protein A9Q81_19105 [Gammaproteobacteria bacterium 42_54_T18]|nr:hypothetical protein A9Q81_19105 [Gammaproteobacteria bacterium 42_54_T18]